MNCPSCGCKLVSVIVISYAAQTADLSKDGRMTNFGTPEITGDIVSVECPSCFETLDMEKLGLHF